MERVDVFVHAFLVFLFGCVARKVVSIPFSCVAVLGKIFYYRPPPPSRRKTRSAVGTPVLTSSGTGGLLFAGRRKHPPGLPGVSGVAIASLCVAWPEP